MFGHSRLTPPDAGAESCLMSLWDTDRRHFVFGAAAGQTMSMRSKSIVTDDISLDGASR
jgi:hypothetical protein